MALAAEKARTAGAGDVLLCERGTFFGYNDLVVDMRALLQLRDCGYPVVFDATHSAQKPGGDRQSGGAREVIAPLARAAAAVGINGLFRGNTSKTRRRDIRFKNTMAAVANGRIA